MDSYDCDEDDDIGYRRKSRVLSRRPNFLDDLFDDSIQKSMGTPLFKLVREWISGQVGLDVTYLVWTIAIFASVRKYGGVAITWLSRNVTNSLELGEHAAALTDLRIWIRKQPSHAMLSLLPSFEHLEWTDVAKKTGIEVKDGAKAHELLSSAGFTPFSYQGIPFVLCKPKGLYEANSTLRCLWTNAKPIERLLKEVQRKAMSQTTDLSIFSVNAHTWGRGDGYEGRRCRKRLIETIDLDPLIKQELVADLQDFFDEDTEEYYHQNGIPYRRGYLFYGPAGTGKTSLSTAIASHYDLSLCVINLADMNDSELQEQVQRLPKRCVILFEDIDSAGVARKRTMVSREAESDSGAYLKEKQSGKPRFEYDINRAVPEPSAEQQIAEDHPSEDFEETPPSSNGSSEATEKAKLNFEEHSFSSSFVQSVEAPEREGRPTLSVTSSSDTESDDGLAYGEYHSNRADASNTNPIGKGIVQKITEFFDVLMPASPMVEAGDIRSRNISVPEMVMPSLNMNADQPASAWASQQAALRAFDQSELYTAELSQSFHGNLYHQGLSNFPSSYQTKCPLQSLQHVESVTAPPLHEGKVTLGSLHGEPPSPSASAGSSVYYTPLSIEEQIDASFRDHRHPNHAAHHGQSGAHLYHGHLSDIEEDNPWGKAAEDRDDKFFLQTVEPRPLDDLEHLSIHQGGGE